MLYEAPEPISKTVTPVTAGLAQLKGCGALRARECTHLPNSVYPKASVVLKAHSEVYTELSRWDRGLLFSGTLQASMLRQFSSVEVERERNVLADYP